VGDVRRIEGIHPTLCGTRGQGFVGVKIGGNVTVQGRGQVLEAWGRRGLGRPARGGDGKSVCHWASRTAWLVVAEGGGLGEGVWEEDDAARDGRKDEALEH
jgi:hypothetical protein